MHSPHATAATARSYQRLLPVIFKQSPGKCNWKVSLDRSLTTTWHHRTTRYSWNIPKQLLASRVYRPQKQGQEKWTIMKFLYNFPKNTRYCWMENRWSMESMPVNRWLQRNIGARGVARYCVPVWIAANPAYRLASLLFACIAFHRSDVKSRKSQGLHKTLPEQWYRLKSMSMSVCWRDGCKQDNSIMGSV